MSDTPAPLPPEQVDELLSAELDGEFDAAARDLGFEPEGARARLDATPGASDRRDALTEARTLLGEIPEYDELVATRIRAKATNAAAAAHERGGVQRRSRWLTAVGAAAAAILLVVGVGLALNNGSNDSSSKNSAASAAADSAPASTVAGPTNTLGSAPNARALADALRKSAAKRQALAGTPGNDVAAPASEKNSEFDALNSAVPKAATSNATASVRAAQACAKQAQGFAATSTRPIRYGTATVAGQPVLVAEYVVGPAEVVVIMTPDCALLLQQTFPASP